MKRTVIIIVMSVLAFAGSAYAQRTMNKQCSISGCGSFNGVSWGTELDVSGYTLAGLWYGGVRFNDYRIGLSSGDDMHYGHLTGNGGYMFRIAGTRNRCVNLYVGGGIFCGIEIIDPLKDLRESLVTDLNRIAFLYGLEVRMLGEFFVSRTVALTLSGIIAPNFSSQIGWFNYNIGTGIKIML